MDNYYAHAKSDAMERYPWLTLNRPSYGTQAYSKPEVTLRTLEKVFGPVWPKVMRTYHQRWRFKHPDAQDFIATVHDVTGQDMTWFFDQALYGTNLIDYSVSFTNGRGEAGHGYFDDHGKPTLATGSVDWDPEDAHMITRPAPKPNGVPLGAIESEVLVRRLGEMIFPVVVRVKFADGSEVHETWEVNDPALPAAGAPAGLNQYRWKKFKYAKKVVSAEADPDSLFKSLEIHRVDNTAQLDPPTNLAADKWYLRWVVWIQNALMAFSYFS